MIVTYSDSDIAWEYGGFAINPTESISVTNCDWHTMWKGTGNGISENKQKSKGMYDRE